MKAALEEARELLAKVTGEEILAGEVKVSDKADLTSTVAFRLAKKQKKNPKDLADELAGKIKPMGLISSIGAVNGYINFTLDYTRYCKLVLESIRQSEGGYGKPMVSPEDKIVLEHTSVNPSGPIHVGRLRNSIIGDSLRRILSFYGFDVETHYFVNDIGKQIALIALAFKENLVEDNEIVERYSKFKDREDFQVFFKYVAANKKLEEDEKFKEKVQELIKKAETGDTKILHEIKATAEKCLKGQNKLFNRLDISFDSFDFESKYIEDNSAAKVVEKLMKASEWTKKDIGSGLDLKKKGIEKRSGLTVLQRTDGTSVYLARDLAYHLDKQDKGDKLINVLGEDHKLQAKELKTILTEFLDFKKPIEAVHYSFVSFDGSKLSTRKGEIASVDELLDEAQEKASIEVEKREIGGKEVAEEIAVGAVKYQIAKTTPNKPITFNWSEALSFDGESAPYIQYVHARSCRILEKSEIDATNINVEEIDLNLEDAEKELVKQLGLFPDIVEQTAMELKPNMIANYTYQLASIYNKFYIQCQVLEAEEKVKERRLLLVYSTKEVIKTGLDLLGIKAPEKM